MPSCVRLHDAHDVAEERRLDDPVVVDTMKLRVTQERHLVGGRNSQPVTIEQAHHVTHAGDPGRVAAVNVIVPGHEDVFPALHGGQRPAQRQPENLGHRLCAFLFVERVHAAPQIIVRSARSKNSAQVFVTG
jgi:hypothetical protein